LKNQRGFVLLLTFAFLIVLVQLVAAMTILLSGETLDIGAQWDDKRLLYLADAGVERALREIRNDQATTTQTGVAYLRGGTPSVAGGAFSGVTINNIRHYDVTTATIDSFTSGNGDIAQLTTFDNNYTNTRIISVSLIVRASRASGGTGATLQVSYSTNGSFPQVGSTPLIQALTTSLTNYPQDITGDRTWTWATLMSANFALRAQSTAGNRAINLDAMGLLVTYEIDTNTEPWFTGSYQTYPLSLGSGTVQSVSITAEQGKIHLNTATQVLLRYLMFERGVVDATANTVATNIVNYRAVKNFDSVEELQQVTGMTATIYNLIKDYVTVYSFINTSAQRPAGSRAPVNINTASREVLEAIFDDQALLLGTLGATDPASLATDIINTRAATPFTCYYSADGAVTRDFFDFVAGRAYLTATEQNIVRDIVDPSLVTPTTAAGVNATTTEFSYDTNTFKIESLADISGRRVRVKTILNDQGTTTFTTFVGDTTSVGYRKENFE